MGHHTTHAVEILLLFVFGFLHLLLHAIDWLFVWTFRGAAQWISRSLGLSSRPASGVPDTSTRMSQQHRVVDMVTPDFDRAQSWFGWPADPELHSQLALPRGLRRNNDERNVARKYFPFAHPRYDSHLSTILSHFKPAADIQYRRELVEAQDGCQLVVDWAYPEDNTHFHRGPTAAVLSSIAEWTKDFASMKNVFRTFGTDPESRACLADAETARDHHVGVFSIVPGLLSRSDTTYIRSFVRAALAHDFVVAVVHTRGFIKPLTAPKMFHGGMTDDLRHWTYNHLSKEALHNRFGRPTNAVIVGFSLGANVLGKFLAEDGEKVTRDSAVVCAAAVSAPWRFADVKKPMSRFVQRQTYDRDFRVGLQEYLRENETALRNPSTGEAHGFDWARATKVRSVPEFDEHVVVPHHGFGTRDNYYEQVSCFPRLPLCRTPLVCVGVADDPICGPPPSPAEWVALCAKNPNIVYAELPSGGHLGCLGHPLAELTRQPTALESLVCRSMAHFLVKNTTTIRDRG